MSRELQVFADVAALNRAAAAAFAEIVKQAVERLNNGRLVLYTASAIVDGKDTFREAIQGVINDFEYEELDPDVFGEELSRDVYSEVDRIAVVALDVNGNDPAKTRRR